MGTGERLRSAPHRRRLTRQPIQYGVQGDVLGEPAGGAREVVELPAVGGVEAEYELVHGGS
ncbi:hypothetical protein [Streptomyces chartreusis]